MTDALAGKTCTPCKGGVPPLTVQEVERLQGQVPHWEVRDEAHRMERRFKFGNFGEALRFVQQVGELAEAERIGTISRYGPASSMRRAPHQRRPEPLDGYLGASRGSAGFRRAVDRFSGAS